MGDGLPAGMRGLPERAKTGGSSARIVLTIIGWCGSGHGPAHPARSDRFSGLKKHESVERAGVRPLRISMISRAVEAARGWSGVLIENPGWGAARA
jgi:hypothetical protein